MALIDDFKARFSEFDDQTVEQLLPVLEPVWPAYFGGLYAAKTKEIVLNLLAHLLVLEISAGPANLRGVVSQGFGGVSVSYVAPAPGSATTDFFGSTKYGQRYLHLTSFYYSGDGVV